MMSLDTHQSSAEVLQASQQEHHKYALSSTKTASSLVTLPGTHVAAGFHVAAPCQ